MAGLNQKSDIFTYLYVDDDDFKWKIRLSESTGDFNNSDIFDVQDIHYNDVPWFPGKVKQLRFIRLALRDQQNSAGVFIESGRYLTVPILKPTYASQLIGKIFRLDDIEVRVVSFTGEKLPAIAGRIKAAF